MYRISAFDLLWKNPDNFNTALELIVALTVHRYLSLGYVLIEANTELMNFNILCSIGVASVITVEEQAIKMCVVSCASYRTESFQNPHL